MMTTSIPTLDPEDRRKHLELIQGAVDRMAGSSASAKSWLLPVVTAAFGFSLVQREVFVGLLGLGSVLLFAFLDAQYLRQERAFRALYRDAAIGRIPVFEINPSRYYNGPNHDEDDHRSENCRWNKVIWSWSLAGFYGPMILVGLGILMLCVPWRELISLTC
jgi:hypothetical protein